MPTSEEIRKLIRKEMEDILYFEKQMRELELLTEKRIELLRTIMSCHPTSIRELAEKLHRDVKNVFEDLQLLHKMNLVGFEKVGRKKKPVVKKKIIIIKLG